MAHIALLGDSILDNGSYTRGEPDVVTHLRAILPEGQRASLLAADGAVTRSLAGQVARLPPDVTHIVVSIGGNDALGHSDLIRGAARLTADPLRHLAGRLSTFESDYRSALARVFAAKLPTTLCTIYNGALTDPDEAVRARIGLMLFNDVILRVAFEHCASVIDLRLVCSQPADYANPIEPSSAGGLKIARAILRAARLGAGGDHSAVIA